MTRTEYRRVWLGPLVAVVVAAVSLVACASGKDEEPEYTMDVRESEYRIKTHIEETLDQFPDTAKLTDPYKMDSLPCDWSDESKQRVIVEHSYFISGLSSEDFPEYFDKVEQYWKRKGYKKLRVDREGPSLELVYTDPDDFRLRLATDADGEYLIIRSQSPCIWPNGMPPENG